jgi:hypothetical protein
MRTDYARRAAYAGACLLIVIGLAMIVGEFI